MCPSVKFLRLEIQCANTCQDAINSYLVSILKKLPNLKTVELPIFMGDNICIDSEDLPKIEKVIFVKRCILDFYVHFENIMV
jgi:hypothetical protein